MIEKYILEGHETIKCKDLLEWAKQCEKIDRHVADTRHFGIRVSTVFLGVDHNYGFGSPLLFETMIFGGRHNDYQERYTTWEEAERGHKKACALAFPVLTWWQKIFKKGEK